MMKMRVLLYILALLMFLVSLCRLPLLLEPLKKL